MASRPRPLVAGNWKMNGLRANLAEVRTIRDAVGEGAAGNAEVLICPPFTLVAAAAEIVDGSGVKIGGQNSHRKEEGAYTGDVSAQMLLDAGATYVILGHSERRADHNETNLAVRRKAKTAMAAGLKVIVCVGETKADRDGDQALAVVHRQIHGSLAADMEVDRLVVAYEPVWAIGTGVTPNADDVGEMHGLMRDELKKLFPSGAETIRLLYGGSVKPSNAAELLAVDNVDGALVGGASLTAKDFLGIAGVYREHAAAVD